MPCMLQVYATSLPAGTYLVRVSHKGSLWSGLDQAYSLAASVSLAGAPVGVDEVTAAAGGASGQTIHPNPFPGSTTISYRIPQSATVDLTVFDVRGRQVRTLERGAAREAGAHRVAWDGRDDAGRPLPAGVYFSQLEAGGVRSTEKLVLLRTD